MAKVMTWQEYYKYLGVPNEVIIISPNPQCSSYTLWWARLDAEDQPEPAGTEFFADVASAQEAAANPL